MTLTQKTHHEHGEEFSRRMSELAAVIRKEFPVGAKVRWMFGRNWQRGEVIETATYNFSNEVKVRNTKTGKTRSIRAVDLELA